MTRRFGPASPLLWGVLGTGMTLLTAAAYAVDSYKISERCYDIVEEYAGSKGIVSEDLGFVGSTDSLIPLGSRCTWRYEEYSVDLYPVTSGIVTTLAVMSAVLLGITALVWLLTRRRDQSA